MATLEASTYVIVKDDEKELIATPDSEMLIFYLGGKEIFRMDRVLQPVELKDVPTEEMIDIIADNYQVITGKNDTERSCYLHGQQDMIRELTPLIASQQNEIVRLKSELLFRDSAELPERDAEIERQQNRIAELAKRSEKLNEVSAELEKHIALNNQAMTKIQELELQIAALAGKENEV